MNSFSEDSTDKQVKISNDDDKTPLQKDSYIKEIVLTVYGGTSFDSLFRHFRVSGREVIALSTYDVVKLTNLISSLDTKKLDGDMHQDDTNTSLDSNHWSKDIINKILTVGVERTILNIECCSEYSAKSFGSSENSGKIQSLIVACISKGIKVIVADFALKALINWWPTNELGNCPFIDVGDVDGNMIVRFPIDTCRECNFEQLSAVAHMALPDKFNASNKLDKNEERDPPITSLVMGAMRNTIVYTLNEFADRKNVKVMSVCPSPPFINRNNQETITPVLNQFSKIDKEAGETFDKTTYTKSDEKDENNDDEKCDEIPEFTVPILPPPLKRQKQRINRSDTLLLIPFTKLQRQNVYDNLSETDLEKKYSSKCECEHPSGPSLKHQVSGPLKIDSPLPIMPPPSTQNLKSLEKISKKQQSVIMDIDTENKSKNKSEPELESKQSIDDISVAAHGTNGLKGIPIHTIVNFPGKPGTLIVSSLHLKNLVSVNTNVSSVLRVASNCLDAELFRQVSIDLEFEASKKDAPSLQRSISCVVAMVATSNTISAVSEK
jgi:hypothetical protein